MLDQQQAHSLVYQDLELKHLVKTMVLNPQQLQQAHSLVYQDLGLKHLVKTMVLNLQQQVEYLVMVVAEQFFEARRESKDQTNRLELPCEKH
jgi:hypothetical protein